MRNLIIIFITLISLSLWAKEITTFTAIEPIEFIVEQITQNEINHHALISQGQEPHNFSPTPRQLVKLSQANIYFSIDMPFEKLLIGKVKTINKNIKVIDISKNINKISIGGGKEHKGHHEHHSSCNHGTLDPHIWLSPKNLIILSKEIAKELSSIDSANSAKYKESLSKLLLKLEILDNNIAQQLKPFYGKKILVFHPSFGYFMKSYNLEQKSVEIEGKNPTPKQIHHLIEEAKEDNIKIIFTQPQFDKRSANIIATQINGKVEELNPLAKDIISNIANIANKIEGAFEKDK